MELSRQCAGAAQEHRENEGECNLDVHLDRRQPTRYTAHVVLTRQVDSRCAALLIQDSPIVFFL